MLDVILFAIQQLVKFLSQSINYSSIPIQYSCLLTVTTINTQTTHTTVATANSVATAVALTDVQLIVILHLWNILPNIIHLPFFFFPNNFQCFFLFFFCFICFDIFSSSYPSFWFASQSSFLSSSFPSQLSQSYNPDFEFDSETTRASTFD